MIIMSLFIFSVTLSAGPLRSPQDEREGYGGPNFGVMFIDVGSINNYLKPAGYTVVDSTFSTIGGGGYGLVNGRLLLGGSGYAVLANTTESTSVKGKVSGGYGFFEVGYAVFKMDNFSLFPVLGIGGGGMSFDLVPLASNSLRFYDILLDPKRSSKLSCGSFALELALQNTFTLTVVEEKNEDKIEAFKMGGAIKLGMIYDLNNDWSMDEFEVSSAPKIPREKYFINFTILFGGYEKDLKKEEQK